MENFILCSVFLDAVIKNVIRWKWLILQKLENQNEFLQTDLWGSR